MGKIEDRRRERQDGQRQDGQCAFGFVVFTDAFMSGWGGAGGGRSLYALEVESEEEAYVVLANGKDRTEMKRGRFVKTLDGIKLRKTDHLSVADKTTAARWFEPGGFRK